MKKWLILLCMISAFVGCGNEENEIKQNLQEKNQEVQQENVSQTKESQNQSKETFINEERSLRSQSPQKWLEKYDVNAKDSNGETLLMFFAAYGSDDEVKYLLAQGADINATDKQGQSALFYALFCGAEGCIFDKVKTLVEAGADINAKNAQGDSVLRVALGSSKEIEEYLKSKGALDSKSFDESINNLSEQEISRIANPRLVEVVRTYNGKVGIKCIAELLQSDNIDEALKEKQEVSKDIYAYEGQSALLLAAKFGYDELVAALLELGANPNMVGYYTTPLLEAATNNYYHISKLLLEHGADVNLRAQDDGTTPIIALVEGESKGFLSIKDEKERTKEEDKTRIPLLELFIKSGGDVNVKDFKGDGVNALYLALELERENLAVLLIQSGADVKDESYPPLNDAVKYGLVNAVEALLKVGANPMQKGYSQTSVLDIIGENKLERINGEYARTLFHSLESEKQSRIKELINQAIETINP
ncbi:ankyrin repeat domain-containing protein [Helicobacter japonicus]|uniref:ankyrin repeat domain-containing protein n=1 Tax=Helicobacter japonicus TaxID=425400 RepID=UPI0023F58DD3|nr:ankyrin repeat domain-containing protein [Helicobacter japonicus]